MAQTDRDAVSTTDLFKALGDPVRWNIVQQMAAVDELACATLEKTLTISKPTISYHTKILVQAGLVSVRKESRNFYYTLRRDVLRSLVGDLWEVAPEPRPVREGRVEHSTLADRRRHTRSRGRLEPVDAMAVGGNHEAVLLTW